MTRTALVTGGSSGIGLAIVARLARQGDRVLTCGTREKAPDALRELPEVRYQACDLGTSSGRASLVDLVRREAPRLDLLVHNAGIQHLCEIAPGLSAADVEREIAINLTAPILLSAALVPELEAASGTLVNVSSGLALAPKASAPVYCATKAGLSSFSRTLRYQLSTRGIRVVDVATPLVRTPMTAGRHDGAMDPDVFAERLLVALDSGRDEIDIGRARLLRWLLRVAPALAHRIMRDA